MWCLLFIYIAGYGDCCPCVSSVTCWSLSRSRRREQNNARVCAMDINVRKQWFTYHPVQAGVYANFFLWIKFKSLHSKFMTCMDPSFPSCNRNSCLILIWKYVHFCFQIFSLIKNVWTSLVMMLFIRFSYLSFNRNCFFISSNSHNKWN